MTYLPRLYRVTHRGSQVSMVAGWSWLHAWLSAMRQVGIPRRQWLDVRLEP
jgi:hypothetical protein